MFASGKKVVGGAGSAFTSRCNAYISSNQSIPTGVFTKIQFDTEMFDGDNEFDSTVNFRFTATNAGYYSVAALVYFQGMDVNSPFQMGVVLNGSTYISAPYNDINVISTLSPAAPKIIYLAANDYLEVEAYHSSVGNKNILAGRAQTYFSIHRLS